jgi:hypothetical protein
MQTKVPAQKTQQNQSQSGNKSSQSGQAQFEDARPEAAAQLRMQSLMTDSPQTTQLKSAQAMMAAKPNNTGMPNQLKAGIENLSGMSMDHVRVHYNSDKPAQLQAHAYAQGSDIHIAPGQEKHLPHEAWHVVQQAQGRVKPTMQMKDAVPVNDDAGLEHEADVMGAKALQQVAFQKKELNPVTLLASAGESVGTFQRKILIGNNYVIHYDDGLVNAQHLLVKPYLAQWDQMDTIFDKGRKSATKAAKDKYLDETLENDIRAMLRKYNEVKAFADDKDLCRQLVQDIKLSLLGMDSIVGTDHADGQFSQVDDDSSVGRDGKTRKLRIYRTMPYTAWKAYKASNDLKDILWGHGGSLGQALDYFLKSKASGLDDVLVEFEFAGTAQSLVDYEEI